MPAVIRAGDALIEEPIDVPVEPLFVVASTRIGRNFAAFGGSLATSPDKSAPRIAIPRGEERLEVLEVPLFAMRAERRAWDARAHARFVQSTRHG